MKKALILFATAFLLQSCDPSMFPQGGNSGGGTQRPSGGGRTSQPNPNDGNDPTNGRAADNRVSVASIRLTDRYTILYMTYTDNGQKKYTPNGQLESTGDIAFHPKGRLIAAEGAREFNFVKVEGIPQESINPNGPRTSRRKTYPGDVINFVVYFDRLDKGLENFDLFECNDYDKLICWNIYGLNVANPADNVYIPPANPQPQSQPTPEPSRTPSSTIPSSTGTGSAGTKTPKKSGKVGEVDTPKPESTPTPPAVQLVNVSGIVRDSKTNRPISATINFKLSSSIQVVDSVQSFASTGMYRMSLPKGQVYTYVSHAKGYISANDVLDLSKVSGGQKVSKDIYLVPLVVGDKITLKNIYFEASKSDLLPASYSELNKLQTMMEDNPTMEIRLEGHTDIIGDPEANQELSEDRVNACREYLAKKGIATARIQTVGYGSTKPIVLKGTDEERKVNRRVEFVVLKL
jgi:OmpA-OmpF porin, OOP family